MFRRTAAIFLMCALGCLSRSLPAFSQATPAGAGSAQAHDPQHDFDWDIGTWKTHMRRLMHPLTGSTTWVEYNGTDVVRKIWDGRANFERSGGRRTNGSSRALDSAALQSPNPPVEYQYYEQRNGCAQSACNGRVQERTRGVHRSGII
jgi:hypothetical protein